MKNYNFISDDRLYKTRFCKKKKGGGLTKTFLIKRVVGAKMGGGEGLERFLILRGRGVCGQKERGDFFKGGEGVHTLAPTILL